MEIILYRGNMPTVFFNKGDADAALRGGQYRRGPTARATLAEPSNKEQISEPVDPTEESTKEPPKPDSINVNSASLVELTEIKGIGLAKGREVIEGRPYRTAEDLIAVTEAADWMQLEQDGDIWFG